MLSMTSQEAHDKVKALKKGESAVFNYGNTAYTIKKHSHGVFCLFASNVHTRARWGNLAEITTDLIHCLTFNTLPGPDGKPW